MAGNGPLTMSNRVTIETRQDVKRIAEIFREKGEDISVVESDVKVIQRTDSHWVEISDCTSVDIGELNHQLGNIGEVTYLQVVEGDFIHLKIE